MNAKNLIAAFAVLTAAGSAFADSTYPVVEFNSFVSTKTRAEVVAEMKQPAAQPAANKVWVEFNNVAADKTRAEVRNEASQAAKEGPATSGQ